MNALDYFDVIFQSLHIITVNFNLGHWRERFTRLILDVYAYF